MIYAKLFETILKLSILVFKIHNEDSLGDVKFV